MMGRQNFFGLPINNNLITYDSIRNFATNEEDD